MSKKNKNTKLKFIIFILFFIVAWALGRYLNFNADDFKNLLAKHYHLSGIIYIVAYILATTFIWIGTIDFFRITGAIFFGANYSTLLVFIAETLSSIILFLISRKLGKEYIQEKFKIKDTQFEKTKKDSSFWVVLALRINPLISDKVLDVCFALTDLSLKRYLFIVIISSPIRIYWLQYVLSVVGESIYKPMELIAYLQEDLFLVRMSLIYFLLVLIISVIAVVKRKAKSPNLNQN